MLAKYGNLFGKGTFTVAALALIGTMAIAQEDAEESVAQMREVSGRIKLLEKFLTESEEKIQEILIRLIDIKFNITEEDRNKVLSESRSEVLINAIETFALTDSLDEIMKLF